MPPVSALTRHRQSSFISSVNLEGLTVRKLKTLTLIFVFVAAISRPAHAELLVYDPINGAYNQIRNALMELYHIEDIKNAIEQLTQLENTFNEMKRVNFGVDEIFARFLGDFKSLLYRNNTSNLSGMGFDLSQIQQEFYQLVNGTSGGASPSYKSHLDSIFGKDPNSQTKPYITQEELFAADSYRWAGDVKQVIDQTITAGEDISNAAQSASPKGSARLTADALGKIIVTQAQIQQNQSKQIEIGATQIEQVSREEKYYERERLGFMDDFNSLLDELPAR